MFLKLNELSKEAKISMLLEAICGSFLIVLGIASKEILGILAGFLLWIYVFDMYAAEVKEKTIKMFDTLCSIQQEILAEKFGCSRAEIDEMCTEKLRKKNEEMKEKLNGRDL